LKEKSEQNFYVVYNYFNVLLRVGTINPWCACVFHGFGPAMSLILKSNLNKKDSHLWCFLHRTFDSNFKKKYEIIKKK